MERFNTQCDKYHTIKTKEINMTLLTKLLTETITHGLNVNDIKGTFTFSGKLKKLNEEIYNLIYTADIGGRAFYVTFPVSESLLKASGDTEFSDITVTA